MPGSKPGALPLGYTPIPCYFVIEALFCLREYVSVNGNIIYFNILSNVILSAAKNHLTSNGKRSFEQKALSG
jgi:hypothetical protein